MEKSKNIYMDYAASALPNPSSIHSFGVQAKNKLEKTRKDVGNILGTQGENIIFTSGGTESNNLAIQGVVFSYLLERNIKNIKSSKLPHIITTNIEHPSVLETCKLLEKRNLAELSIIPVELNGIVDSKKIKKEIRENTVLVSVMYANNEIGTIQPIREISKEIRHYKKTVTKNSNSFPYFHIDAAQAVNYLDLNVERLGIDLLSLSGTKIGVGTGILFKKKNVNIVNILGGGDQEMGLRPGTENLKEILKFSLALKKIEKNKEKENKRILELRNYFIKKIPSGYILNGDIEFRLPNNINITFPKIPSDLLVIEFSSNGIMISSKSACNSLDKNGSYVIKAIHPELDSTIGGLRFSFGKDTSKKDIDYTIKVLNKILKKLKQWY
jgi:cysteine desulfurase